MWAGVAIDAIAAAAYYEERMKGDAPLGNVLLSAASAVPLVSTATFVVYTCDELGLYELPYAQPRK